MSSSAVENANISNTKLVAAPVRQSLVRACLIWGLAALFYFYDYLLQVSPSAMKPELMQSFVKEAEQFGSLSAYFLYAYGLMQIPAGLLLDRFGPRRVITLACVLCASGSFVFGFAETLWFAKLGRILIGAGASFALVSCLKIASVWFPMSRYALLTGMTVTVGFLGAAFGLASVSKVVEVLGWRDSMHWGAAIGFVLSACLWMVVRDKSNEDSTRDANVEPMQTNLDAMKGLSYVLKDKQTWIAALFAGLMFVPTLAIGGLWGIPFLVEAQGFDRTTAGLCVSLIYLGWVFGGSFWGFFSDYIGRRNLPMMVANVVTFIITLCIIYIDYLPLPVLQGLLFGLGFFSSGFIIAFAVVGESNPPHLSATATGFTNALNTLWGAAAQPLIGWILDLNHKVTGVVGVEQIFNLKEYRHAFLALPVCLTISFLILLSLKETHCRVNQP